MATNTVLPNCGIYRTSEGLPGNESAIPAGRLVFFHNHSEKGPPLILLPESNAENKWTFQTKGFLVNKLDYASTLRPLMAEGVYILRSEFKDGDRVFPARSLVQLGYNQSGEAILFRGRWENNSILFPDKGLKAKGDSIFRELDPAGFVVARVTPQPSQH
jgi:hypothetical protein